jgi:EAL domain-containing protein (putative c-di-GMP-specific phosphodiesterase class I)/GGDEF domain-containing protein
MTSQLLDILRHGGLHCLFQPILELETGRIHGHEGLIRGPSDSMLHAPLALLRTADQAGMRGEVELICLNTLVREFTKAGLPGLLFLNLSPSVLCSDDRIIGRLLGTLAEQGLAPERVVIELTEGHTQDTPENLIATLSRIQETGLRFALDDLGEGFSSLRRWVDLKPEYVKIDKHFISSLNQDPLKLQFVRSIQQIASQSGARLIAEGIETRAEFAIVRELGIGYGQGYFIARPSPLPGLSLEVLDALKTQTHGRHPAPAAFLVQASKLLIQAPSISPRQNNETALDLFIAHPHLHALAVVDNDRPVGLINRYILIDHFSRVFIRELHGKRPCVQFMDNAPLIVDKCTPIEELSRLVIHKGKSTFTDGFIITESSRYLGLGSGYDLMEVIMQLQIAAARYSNPLTMLPGNVPINNHIEQLLQEDSTFWAAYCDLDNFKPFNDIYGYDRGDEVILLLAGILKDHVDTSQDFLGHIGGDDFFILFRSEDWEIRCQRILDRFALRTAELFDPRHRLEGGYFSEDRRGRTVFHPLPTLSIGCVPVHANLYPSHHEISTAAAMAKKQAKKLAGNSLFVERRQGAYPLVNSIAA